MALDRKGWMRKLEKRASEGLDSFELRDGSRFFFDRAETDKELFLYAYAVQLGEARPEPPEVYRKMCEAKVVAAVLERFRPENPQGAFVDPANLFDLDALVDERRLVPVVHEPPRDLSTQGGEASEASEAPGPPP